MKQVLLFVASANANELIPAVKRDVIEYLGSRMVEEDFYAQGVPMIGLKDKITAEDKTQIAHIVADRSDDIATIVMHDNEAGELDKNVDIMDVIMYQEPMFV